MINQKIIQTLLEMAKAEPTDNRIDVNDDRNPMWVDGYVEGVKQSINTIYSVEKSINTSGANLDLLKEAAKELQAIKNGKGINKQMDKMTAFRALHELNVLIEKLEAGN
ncbi:hypothetical protein [Enterococcus sp. AZ072]|uniref:hypothetical protein n=1 Tax=unclassified Enterococcus TaxID=2608891 RepID=UPI003D291BBE